MHRREKERLIVAKNHELKQELYWFLDDTEHLAEIELENFQTWINHLWPVDAHVVYPDFEENIPNKLRRQSKKYGFDIFVYDILIVEGAKMLSFLETIIAKEKELLRNIKAMIKLIKASQEVETRILNYKGKIIMYRIGNSIDIHPLSKGAKLRIGGVEVPAPFGSISHSDGDAVRHSIAEAI